MIVQCPACRALVELSHVEVRADTAWVTCTACAARTALAIGPSSPAAVPLAAVPPAAVPPAAVPPAAVPPAAVPPAAVPPAAVPPAAAPDALRRAALVRRTLANDVSTALVDAAVALAESEAWETPARHKSLLSQTTLAELPHLGGMYRAVLELTPTDNAAKQAREALLSRAMAEMVPVAPTPVASTPPRALTVLAVLLATVFVLGLVWVFVRQSPAVAPSRGESGAALSAPRSGPL